MEKFGYNYSDVKCVNGGIRYLFDFGNGYGASVVRHSFSYGGSQGLWELAVLLMKNGESQGLAYDTPVTGDVEGHLSEEDVQRLLEEIEQLPIRVAA